MDIKSKEARSRNMAKIKSHDTKPELYIRSLLFKQGLRYRVNYSAIEGKPDLYFPKYKVAVFIHGCFWHRHRDCRFAYVPKTNIDFWSLKFSVNCRRDELVVEGLTKCGIRTLILWECTARRMKRSDQDKDQIIRSVDNFIRLSNTIHLEL